MTLFRADILHCALKTVAIYQRSSFRASYPRPDYDGSTDVVCTLVNSNRALVCQAPPDTYLRICEVIDSTTALMWSCEESYDRCLQLINSPGESCTITAVDLPHRVKSQGGGGNIKPTQRIY